MNKTRAQERKELEDALDVAMGNLTAHHMIYGNPPVEDGEQNLVGILNMPGITEYDRNKKINECQAVIDGKVCGQESCSTVHMIAEGHDYQEGTE